MKKIKTWIKLDNLFIDEENIRAIRKTGKNTIIEKVLGENVIVEINYAKVKKLVRAL